MRGKLSVIAKILLVLMVAWAWRVMLVSANGTLSSTGLRSLRYFTVLSNLLCAAAAVIHLIALARRKGKRPVPAWVLRLSYVGAVAVGVTMMVVLLFLGPMYNYPALLSGANLWFHLIVPLLAVLEHILLEQGERPSFRDTFLAILPTFLYGVGYLGNILLNGAMDGLGNNNDWYFFTFWGLPICIAICSGILLLTWGIALALRALGRARARREKHPANA